MGPRLREGDKCLAGQIAKGATATPPVTVIPA